MNSNTVVSLKRGPRSPQTLSPRLKNLSKVPKQLRKMKSANHERRLKASQDDAELPPIIKNCYYCSCCCSCSNNSCCYCCCSSICFCCCCCYSTCNPRCCMVSNVCRCCYGCCCLYSQKRTHSVAVALAQQTSTSRCC